MAKRWIGFLAAAAAACTEERQPTTPAEDAGPDAASFEPTPPEPPAPPAPPSLDPCPPGWRAVQDPAAAGLVACDPWPAVGRSACIGDEVHWPGGDGCEPVGAACPVGLFAEDLPGGSDVAYVEAGAAGGGDGSLAAPFDSVAAALPTVEDGTILALSRGTFAEPVVLDRPVTLWGACAALTVISPAEASESEASVTLTGAGGSLVRDLTVSAPRPGVFVHATAKPVTLESVVITGSTWLAVHVAAGGILLARSLVVRDTQPRSDDLFGYGVSVELGGRFDGSRIAVERSRGLGVRVTDAGSEWTCEDLVVCDTSERRSDLDLGYGLQVSAGARAELRRAVLERNRTAGALAIQAGSELVAEDLVVRDTRPRAADALGGDGIAVQLGGTAEINRATVERNLGAALFVDQASSSLVGTDIVARDTEAESGTELYGYGLQVSNGARAVVARAAFDRNRSAGVLVRDPDSELTGTDLAIRYTRSRRSDAYSGVGLQTSNGAVTELERVRVWGNRALGLLVAGEGTVLDADDVEVLETESREADADWGAGLEAYGGATVRLRRTSLTANRTFGIIAFHEGTSVLLDDAAVDGTNAAECAAEGCPGAGGGNGLAAFDGASLSARVFRLTGNTLCGALLARGGEADFHDGEVSGNLVGVNVATDGFDTSRLQDGVLYRDNERTLDSAEIPVPEPLGGED